RLQRPGEHPPPGTPRRQLRPRRHPACRDRRRSGQGGMPRRYPRPLPAAGGARQAPVHPGVLSKKEANMANAQALEVQEKKELVTKGEKTVPARFYAAAADIYETDEAL